MLVFYNKNAQSKTIVRGIHYQPHLLSSEERAKGYEVESIPEPDQTTDKIPVLYIDPTTKEFSYEYVDRPLTPEDRIAQLEEQLRITQETIDFLLGV